MRFEQIALSTTVHAMQWRTRDVVMFGSSSRVSDNAKRNCRNFKCMQSVGMHDGAHVLDCVCACVCVFCNGFVATCAPVSIAFKRRSKKTADPCRHRVAMVCPVLCGDFTGCNVMWRVHVSSYENVVCIRTFREDLGASQESLRQAWSHLRKITNRFVFSRRSSA